MSPRMVGLLAVVAVIAYLVVALQKAQRRAEREEKLRAFLARQMVERGLRDGAAGETGGQRGGSEAASAGARRGARGSASAGFGPAAARATGSRASGGSAASETTGSGRGTSARSGTSGARGGEVLGDGPHAAHANGGDARSPAAFPVERPDTLPDFARVGGMAAFKKEVRDTVGLILADTERAGEYGISWNGLLLHGAPGVGKTFLARAMAGEFGLNLLHVSTGDLVEGVIGQSARNVQRVFETAAANRPCLLLFDEFDSIAQRRDAGAQAEERRIVNQLLTSLEGVRESRDVIVVATTNDLEHLDPAVIRPGRFDRHLRVDLPDLDARRGILAAQLAPRPACREVDLDDLARRTQGLTPAVLTQIVDAAALRAFKAASGLGEPVRITMEHLLAALASRGGTDRPTVEEWDWDHLVLPDGVKSELRQLQAMLEDPELARSYGVEPPSGVLLGGPPGTGKTTVARVLAAQARCSFYPVSAADVTSKWVGESERSVRRLFQRARENRPSIIFIDEVDAIASRRGTAGDGSERQLNQLLVEMDGLSGSAGVLVIAATNRPERLDPALLRGGRLSRTITLELPDRAARHAILLKAAARMPTVGVDLAKVAAATEGFSGADLKAACQQAALHALVRATGERNAGAADEGAADHGAACDGDPARDAPATPAVLPEDFVRAVTRRRHELADQAQAHPHEGTPRYAS